MHSQRVVTGQPFEVVRREGEPRQAREAFVGGAHGYFAATASAFGAA